MAETQDHDLLNDVRRTNWVRLRTLIILRWFAIVGQLGAIFVGSAVYGLSLNIGACFLAVGASIIANLVAIFIYPENKRLTENEVLGMLLFDLLQLSTLLFLTGGLNNPFSLLLLVPVTISATALRLPSTVFIAVAAVVLATLLTTFHIPLRTEMRFIISLPRVFLFGAWVAIVIGVIFLGGYAWKVTSELHSMADAYLATQMALSREQKLTDLGGVIAAAAHELGTPLATIKLVSAELADELADSPELAEDARLINQQADRCRDILRSMGRAGKDDLLLRTTTLSAVINEAADPHKGRGKDVEVSARPDAGNDESEPLVYRRPEIIHGLRNFIQNAVDFAESQVWVDCHWSKEEIRVRIVDDGPGYPLHLIGRIGDPFIRARGSEEISHKRPGYEGMGLGLFIAKTLLERSGAELFFANASDPLAAGGHRGRKSGALVEISWPREKITPAPGTERQGLGENQRFDG